MGKAHHMHYLSWFELGRIELLRANGVSQRNLEELGVFFPVTVAEIEFRQSASYDDDVLVWTDLGELRSSSATFSHEARRADDNGLLARGRTVVACTDRDGRLRSIPGAVVRSLIG
ncbi:MAG: acyl-CoA thioesterase [marine benthic group bacterium]|nr:acyl-CoA thioesterase [Gemmatimonadota bacterium]